MRKLVEAVAELPTLFQGHSEDLKIETENYRVWLSRVDNTVSIEELVNGRWLDVVGDD